MAKRVPGLIIEIENDTGTVAPPLFERYPVYIGVGDPYKLVSDYQMLRGAGGSDVIPTVTSVNEIVSVGDLPGVAKYVSGTDYQLTAGAVQWLGGGSGPTTGENYYLTFTEARSVTAYEPILYLNENKIYVNHGAQIKTDSNINDVSVSGSLGINAGAGGVIIAQLNPTAWVDPENPTNSELETSFIAMRNLLNKITGYKLFLIPLSSGTLNTTTAANIFFNHSVIASQPARAQERTTMAVMPNGTTYDTYASFAQTYGHERMVVPATPGGAATPAGHAGVFDTRFYVAALAGKICSTEIGLGISDEIIPNITFSDTFTPEELDYMVKRGVSPANQAGGVVRNVLAITTDTTSALTEDLGIQDEKDYIKKFWREGLYPLYRNKKITTNLILAMEDSSENIMQTLLSEEIIADYKNLSIVQDDVEIRQVNVTGKVKPAASLQWINVTFTFALSL